MRWARVGRSFTCGSWDAYTVRTERTVYARAVSNDAKLSRERVVDAALRLIDSDGLGGLSMRRLAAELGVAPMSLYRHVESRDDVEDAVARRLVASVRCEHGPDWRDAIREWGRGYRAMARRHPHALPLLARRPGLGFEVRRGDVEGLFGLLADAGVPSDAAADPVRAAIGLISGFCLLESQRGPGIGSDAVERHREEGFPLTADLLAGSGREPDRLFEMVLGVIIDGLGAEVARHRRR